jgi:hypothetical protein
MNRVLWMIRWPFAVGTALITFPLFLLVAIANADFKHISAGWWYCEWASMKVRDAVWRMPE